MIYNSPPLSQGHHIATTADQLQHMVNAMQTAPERAIDVETNGLKYANGDHVIGAAMGFLASDGRPYCWYVPVAHRTAERQANPAQARKAWNDALHGAKALLGHNLKFDLNMCRSDGWYISPDVELHDTLPQSHMAYERRRFGLEALVENERASLWDPHAAKTAVSAFLKRRAQLHGMPYKKGKYRKPSYMETFGHSEVPIAMEGEYSCRDIAHVLLLDNRQRDRAMGVGEPWEARRRYLYWTEMILVRALAEMEYAGQRVDEQYLISLEAELSRDMEIRADNLGRLFRTQIRWSNDNDIRELLYGKGPGALKLPVVRRTDHGAPSVDRTSLLMLRQEQGGRWGEALTELGEYNARAKVRSTYTLSMARHICRDGRIHASFLQQGTKTGRLSGRDPNLQNIPMRHKVLSKAVRSAFTMDEGITRIYADYSQVELRILAWATGCASLLQAYRSPSWDYMMAETGGHPTDAWYDWWTEARKSEEAIDVHGLQAETTFGSNPAASDWKVKRRAAKIINFGVPYGMGPGGLQGNPELMLSKAEAEGYFAAYHRANPEIDACKTRLFAKMVADARGRTPRFINWAGRSSHGPELNSSDEERVASGQRSLFATLIQGSAAELTRRSLVAWYIRWRAGEITAMATSTVHDEVQYDCPHAEVRTNAIEVRRSMENFHGDFGNTPIICDLETTQTSWADKKDYHV